MLFSVGRGKGLAPIWDRGVLPWMSPGEGAVGGTGGGTGGAAADPGSGPDTTAGGVAAEGERCTLKLTPVERHPAGATAPSRSPHPGPAAPGPPWRPPWPGPPAPPAPPPARNCCCCWSWGEVVPATPPPPPVEDTTCQARRSSYSRASRLPQQSQPGSSHPTSLGSSPFRGCDTCGPAFTGQLKNNSPRQQISWYLWNLLCMPTTMQREGEGGRRKAWKVYHGIILFYIYIYTLTCTGCGEAGVRWPVWGEVG